jgi:glucan-binding YG repeat protein
LGDLNVKENTHNVKYEGSLFTFNEEVAAEIDKIKINLASPSKNPFTYEVKRKGDEYTIRGYANTDKMNKAGVVHLADRWKDATFDELFGETKRYVLQSSSKYLPNFPGIKGYVEGKAIITPSGDIRFTFHEGRTYVESDFFHKPKNLFDLGYYCSWTAVFEGMVTSIFEIKAPDNGGDPTVPFNFNLEESSWVFMNTRTAHNGISIDIGVYAVQVSLEGEIEDADYSRKSIHRPYATDSQKIQWKARFSTGGDLYERNYNRIITSPTDVDIESSNMKKWYSWFRKPGEEPFYLMHNIDATSSGWGSSKVSSFGMPSDFTGTDAYSQRMMVASADAFRLAARGGDSHRLDVDELSAVRYYNGGKGIVYRDSSSNIVTSDIDGNATETVDAKAFGIDIVSAENGSTVASWGSYKGDLDTDALDNIGKDGILKYASGKAEIKAGIFNGANWSITTLTDNEMADITPKTAANGTEGVVVWTQGILNDYHLEGKLPVFTFSESRLMFARYNGSAWGKPAVLYAPSGESIADYSVAMTDNGSALVTAVMGSGKIAIVRISKSGEVTVINNSLPTTTKASLVYNGKSYMLACSSDVKDAEGEDNGRIALALYEISTDGFVTNTTFSGIPTDISGDFNLFRNWSESGAAVLVWRGSGKDNSEARITIYASKVSEANEDNTVLVSAPIAVANINLPTSTGPDAEAGVFVFSYDAYIKGNDLKVLTIFGESSSGESKSGESTPGESDRGVYLAETQAQFKNTIETYSGMNDISGLMPGLQTNFNIRVKNKGFVPITSVNVKIGGGESAANTVRVLPNDETAVTAAFIPTRDLPDSIDYTVTAVFSDGSESTVTGSISLRQADIAAEILLFTLFTQENDDYNIKALISNNTPFSLSGKTVIAGIYQDPFGTVPVTEEKIDGSKFESETLGTSVLVDFSFADAKDLPQSLYLIAKAYDSSNNEIPDKDSMNNILPITNSVFVSATSPGDNGGGSSPSGSSSSDSTTTTTTTPAKTPDQPVTVVAPVTATAGANGAASAAIPDKAITDAIAKAQADAKAQGKTTNGISVGLNVTMPKDATSLTATLTQSSLNSLVSAGVSQLALDGAPVSLVLDLRALQEIQKQSSGNISITIAPATGISDEAKALLGNRPVYNITISYVKDGKTVNVTSLGSGTATLSIPYTPGKNEAVGYLFGVYVDAKGKAQRILGSAYNANSRSLLIPTGHFSVYGVGYTAPSAKFTDIRNHWGKEAIDYVVGRGLLSGTSETTFAPNTAMARGTLITVLGRLSGVDAKAYTTNSFTDVKADSAFRPYIEWAYKKGVVQGIGNQQFAPDRAITREEIAVVFANYAKATSYKLPVTREATAYADASSIGSIYKMAVTAMQQAGIMMGGTDNRFNPKSNATRAEVSSMLHRYIKLTIDPATAQGWALNDAGQWLYYKDGKPLTGAQTIDGEKYFFETTGVLKTGWVKDGDNWRYYSGNKAAIGWLDISDKRYYFTKDGLMVYGKWLQIDGKWYYFYADGTLARSTIIDGYEVNPDGMRKNK